MRFYNYLILNLMLFGCQNSVVEKETHSNSGSDRYTNILTMQGPGKESQLIASNEEFIEWDSLKINGKLALVTNTKDLFSLLGKPDSIVTPDSYSVCSSFYEKDVKYAYIETNRFEIYGDTAVAMYFDFKKTPSLYLKSPKHNFDKNTTIASLIKDFPNSAKEQFESNFDSVGKTVVIRLQASEILSDDVWLLYFLNGKLIWMKYNMPC